MNRSSYEFSAFRCVRGVRHVILPLLLTVWQRANEQAERGWALARDLLALLHCA